MDPVNFTRNLATFHLTNHISGKKYVDNIEEHTRTPAIHTHHSKVVLDTCHVPWHNATVGPQLKGKLKMYYILVEPGSGIVYGPYENREEVLFASHFHQASSPEGTTVYVLQVIAVNNDVRF